MSTATAAAPMRDRPRAGRRREARPPRVPLPRPLQTARFAADRVNTIAPGRNVILEPLADDPPDTFTWIPFGGGTRRCIGAAFAQFEMRIAIETILRSVELRPASPRLERPVRRNVTLSPARGTRALIA